MSLPLPNLDDRRWADLIEEGRALIPFYAPEWTDHNIHDPGITLMELLAWVAEMDLYQLNRIPGRHKRKFLTLVGITPEPPHPARVVLRFMLNDGASILRLPETLEFEGTGPFGQRTLFRIVEPLTVVPGRLQAAQVKDQRGFHDLTSGWQRGEPISLFGDDPRPGVEMYLGFSQALPLNTHVTLFFTFLDLMKGEEWRARVIREVKARREACYPLPPSCEEKQPSSSEKEATDLLEKESDKVPHHHSVRTVWEFLSEKDRWQVLDPVQGQVEDETRSFTFNGRLIVKIPDAMTKKSIGSVGRGLYYIRCRFVAGAYDAPPTLQNLAMNGIMAEQAVPAGTLTWTIAKNATVEGTEPSSGQKARFTLDFNSQGEISQIRFSDKVQDIPEFLVLAYKKAEPTKKGILCIEAILAGSATGRPHQELNVPEAPVCGSSFRLLTLEQNQWHIWHLHPDFDASSPSDYHFLLDPTAGRVTFGDGAKGRVPPKDALIIAAFHATRAEDGNLDQDRVEKLSDALHNRALLPDYDDVKDHLVEITNPFRAVGGSAAKTVAHAAGRAIALIEKPNRAVTLADCEALAMETPGVRLARASARANLHPGLPCFKAPGIITVIILPYLPADRPMPSRELLRTVAAYLARRRVIGTRIEVVGPTFLDVSVRAQVRSFKGTNKADIQKRIKERLNRFFHPLKGGPDEKGWPFGRDVYRSEVLQVIDETTGVDHVLSLELIPGGGNPQCGNLCLGPSGLVAVGQHQIEVV